jgi:hypothetical protein
VENQLIPLLAAHGDFIAGRGPKASKLQTGVVNAAMVDTLSHLGGVYNVQAAIFPGATQFPLPIEPEPAPSLKGGGPKNEPEWGSDDPPKDDPDDILEELQEDVDEQKDRIEFRILELQYSITGPPGSFPTIAMNIVPPEGLDRVESNLEDLLETNLTAENRAKTTAELEQVRALKQKKLQRIAKLRQEMQKLDQEIAEMKQTLAEAATAVTTRGNLSIAHIPRDKMDQAEERYTQWVRASYPYVDAFRAPVLGPPGPQRPRRLDQGHSGRQATGRADVHGDRHDSPGAQAAVLAGDLPGRQRRRHHHVCPSDLLQLQ